MFVPNRAKRQPPLHRFGNSCHSSPGRNLICDTYKFNFVDNHNLSTASKRSSFVLLLQSPEVTVFSWYVAHRGPLHITISELSHLYYRREWEKFLLLIHLILTANYSFCFFHKITTAIDASLSVHLSTNVAHIWVIHLSKRSTTCTLKEHQCPK